MTKHFKGDSPSGGADVLSPAEASALTGNSGDKTLKASQLLDAIKNKWLDSEEFDKLNTLLREANEEEKQNLFKLLDEALQEGSGFSSGDKKDIERIKNGWEQRYKQAEQKKTEVQTSTITKPAKVESTELKKSVNAVVLKRRVGATQDLSVSPDFLNNTDEKKSLEARLRFLTDLDSAGGVENKNKLWGSGDQKYIVGEKQVYEILKDTTKDASALSLLLARLSVIEDWKTETGMKQMHENFREKLLTRANYVANIGSVVLGDRGARSGLVSVLQGTEVSYVETLLKNKENLQKIQKEIDKDPAVTGRDIFATLLSIGVGVATLGTLRFSYETRDLDIRSKGHPLSVALGDGPINFTAKARVLEWALQLNIHDREIQIIKNTGAFIEKLTELIKPGQSVVFPENIATSDVEKEFMNEAIMVYNASLTKGGVGKEYHQALIDTLAHNHMLTLAKAQSGWNFKGLETGYSLLSHYAYVGFTTQNISTRVKDAKFNSATQGESLNMKKSGTLEMIGIQKTIDRETGNTLYTLPFSLPSDHTSQEYKDLIALGAREQAGKVVIVSNTPLNFHQNTVYHHDGSREVVLVVKKNEQTPSRAPLSPLSQEVISKDAQAARSINTTKNLPGSIYAMSRDKKSYPLFDTMLQKVGNRDYDGAYTLLVSMSKKGGITAKNILSLIKSDLSNRNEVLIAINTYTYGGVGKNTEGSMNHKNYMKNRKWTMAAEERLSPRSRNSLAEKFFTEQTTHTPTHISKLVPGQTLGVSVFATPLGGTHRIDKFDGSVQVGGNLYVDKGIGTMSEAQKDFILASHKPEIQKNLQSLNTFLKSTVQLSEDEYVHMLKTHEVPEKLSLAGYSMKKKPVFFEARAMINGNVCMNKVQGLAFPTFEGIQEPVVSELGSDITLGFSAPIGEEVVTTTEIDPGLNIIPWGTGAGGGAGGVNTGSNPGGGIGGGGTAVGVR